MRRTLGAVLLILCLSAIVASPSRADVRVAVSPETLSVAPGATFTLELAVPVAGSAFNGYDAVIEYDPSKLTYLPTSPPSLQEGTSMRAACTGSNWLVFRSGGDSITISHVLMCANATLTGPAQLTVLRFRASTTPGATWVRLRSAQFYAGGLYVNPSITSDALVHWGATLDVPPETPSGTMGIRVRNNPCRGVQWIDATCPVEGDQQLVVFDTAGRAVRRLDAGHRPSGVRAVSWDGRDDAGRPVSPGIYRARLSAAGRTVSASLVRLP